MPEARLRRTRDAYRTGTSRDCEIQELMLRHNALAIAMLDALPIVIEGVGHFREPQLLDEQ